jgi:prophage regulatory protein
MAKNQVNSNQVEKLLRIQDVVSITTLSKSCINLWVSQNKFPKPLTLSSTLKVWKTTDIQNWIDFQSIETEQAFELCNHAAKRATLLEVA